MTSTPIKQAYDLIESVERLALSIAESQTPTELDRLLTHMPWLMDHWMQANRIDGTVDWELTSIAWAVFRSGVYSEGAKGCLGVLKKHGFNPCAGFSQRLVGTRNLALIRDFCEIFEINPCEESPNGRWPLLTYIASDISCRPFDAEPTMSAFDLLVELASVPDNPPEHCPLDTLLKKESDQYVESAISMLHGLGLGQTA